VIGQPDFTGSRELGDFIVRDLADLDAIARDEDIHSLVATNSAQPTQTRSG
jgi:hypothetical protein